MSITWTPWPGGECPVPDATEVLVQYRRGDRYSTMTPEHLVWRHKVPNLSQYDIIAYCIITPYVEGEAQPPTTCEGHDAAYDRGFNDGMDACTARDRFDRYVCAVEIGNASPHPDLMWGTAEIVERAHALMTAADEKWNEVMP